MQGPHADYRSAPVARVIHTRFALLPADLQRAMLESKRDRAEAPYAINLRATGRPVLILVGLVLGFGAYASYMITGGSRLISSDGSLLVIALSMLACALTAWGVVSTARGMTLRLRPQAILYPAGWLTCTTGTGSHVEIIPLSMVTGIVPSHDNALEVRLTDGPPLRYPMTFTLAMRPFFDAARAAHASAERPAQTDLAREVPRPSGAVPMIAGIVAAVVVGLPVGVGATAWNTRRHVAVLVRATESGLASAETEEGIDDPDDRRLRTLEYFVESVATDRAIGGLPGLFLEHTSGLDEAVARFQPMLEAARAVSDDHSSVADRETVLTTVYISELRRVLDAHPSDEIGPIARGRIDAMLIAAREREVAAGATPEALALCDVIAASGRTGQPMPLRLVVRAVTVPPGSFDSWPDAARAASSGSATQGIGAGARRALEEGLHDAYGVTLAYEGGPVVTVDVTLRPGPHILQYTSQNQRTHSVVGSYVAPNLTASVRWQVEASMPFERTTEHATLGMTMAGEHMAAAYPSPELLYAAQGEELGRGIGRSLTRMLCLP